MTPNAFNCDTSRAKDQTRGDGQGRVIAPDWNGQAVAAVRNTPSQTKTTTFKVQLSGGAVTVKKTARPK